MQMPVFLVLFFAPVYVPLNLLNGWIHDVAVVNPVTRILEAGRSFIAGSPTEVAAAFGAAVALSALFSLWAMRGLRKAEAAGLSRAVVRGADGGVAVAERGEERAVDLAGGDRLAGELEVAGRARVMRDGRLEAEVDRGPHGRVDAHARHHPADDDVLDAARPQLGLERGVEEAVRVGLLDHLLAGGGRDALVDLDADASRAA